MSARRVFEGLRSAERQFKFAFCVPGIYNNPRYVTNIHIIAMEKNFKILMLEDDKADYELVERELRKGGLFSFVSKRVDDKESFVLGLRDFSPDIVLADYNLPSFNAPAALDIMQKFSPWIPVIVVTGSVSEEVAVECIKSGASDYVLKDRLTRLAPAVVTALDKVKIEKEREAALETLQRSEERYRTIFDVSPMVIAMVGRDGTVLDINKMVGEYAGYSPEEIIGRNMMDLHFISGQMYDRDYHGPGSYENAIKNSCNLKPSCKIIPDQLKL